MTCLSVIADVNMTDEGNGPRNVLRRVTVCQRRSTRDQSSTRPAPQCWGFLMAVSLIITGSVFSRPALPLARDDQRPVGESLSLRASPLLAHTCRNHYNYLDYLWKE